MARFLDKFSVLSVINLSKGCNQIARNSDCFISDDSLLSGGSMFLVEFLYSHNIDYKTSLISEFEDWLLNQDRDSLFFLDDPFVIVLTTAQVTW